MLLQDCDVSPRSRCEYLWTCYRFPVVHNQGQSVLIVTVSKLNDICSGMMKVGSMVDAKAMLQFSCLRYIITSGSEKLKFPEKSFNSTKSETVSIFIKCSYLDVAMDVINNPTSLIKVWLVLRGN